MKCRVNWRLLPLKAYYFFYSTGNAFIVPYMPLFTTSLGFSVAELGLIYGILDIVGWISQTLVGVIADKLNAHRRIFLLSILAGAVFRYSVYFLPSPHSDSVADVGARTIANVIHNVSATAAAPSSLYVSPNSIIGTTAFVTYIADLNSSSTNNTPRFPVSTTASSVNTTAAVPSLLDLSTEFWLLLGLLLLGRIGTVSTVTVADAVAFDVLEQQEPPASIGRQKAFGTIGWAIGGVALGFGLDWYSKAVGTEQSFALVFHSFFVANVLGLCFSWFLKPKGSLHCRKIFKDVCTVFRNADFVMFTLGALWVGMMETAFDTFAFVYFRHELHASNLLLGLSQLSGCLGEIPLLLVSEKILKLFGHHVTSALAMGAFALRFTGFAFCTSSANWVILGLALLRGPCLGLFVTNMVTFANDVAPVGAAATMHGVLRGIYSGLGGLVGGFAVGMVYQKVGGRATWLILGIAGACTTVIYLLAAFMMWYTRRTLSSQQSIEAIKKAISAENDLPEMQKLTELDSA